MSRESDAEFRRQLEWLGPATGDQIQRRATDELDDSGRRSKRILIGCGIIVALAYVLWWRTADAAIVNLTCKPPTLNVDNTPITAPLAYKAYWGMKADSLTSTAALAGPGCKGPVYVPDAPSGSSVTYHFAVTAIAAGLESDFSNVASKVITGMPKQLLTVGGDVWIASPDWSVFGWKRTDKAGTIAPKMKCDPTRHIPPDLYRVTAPIVWTAGKKNYVVARCEQV